MRDIIIILPERFPQPHRPFHPSPLEVLYTAGSEALLHDAFFSTIAMPGMFISSARYSEIIIHPIFIHYSEKTSRKAFLHFTLHRHYNKRCFNSAITYSIADFTE